jgi:hypothetical protein
MDGGAVSSRRTCTRQLLPVQVLYVRDRDELPDVTVAALEAKGPVRVLPVRELENFFLVDAKPLRKAIAERSALSMPPRGLRLPERCAPVPTNCARRSSHGVS